LRRAVILCLSGLLVLAACGRQNAPQEAELRALRERVERLEREGAAERDLRAQELSAMRRDVDDLRAALDQADMRLAALSGQDPAASPGARPAKSPHADLRQSLRGMYDASRAALERLGKSLDRSLNRAPAASPAVPPAEPTDTPAK